MAHILLPEDLLMIETLHHPRCECDTCFEKRKVNKAQKDLLEKEFSEPIKFNIKEANARFVKEQIINNPELHHTLAHEPVDGELLDIFKRTPSALCIITPPIKVAPNIMQHVFWRKDIVK